MHRVIGAALAPAVVALASAVVALTAMYMSYNHASETILDTIEHMGWPLKIAAVLAAIGSVAAANVAFNTKDKRRCALAGAAAFTLVFVPAIAAITELDDHWDGDERDRTAIVWMSFGAVFTTGALVLLARHKCDG